MSRSWPIMHWQNTPTAPPELSDTLPCLSARTEINVDVSLTTDLTSSAVPHGSKRSFSGSTLHQTTTNSALQYRWACQPHDKRPVHRQERQYKQRQCDLFEHCQDTDPS